VDVALVSFDDPPWAEVTDPPMTTLAQPVRLMAAAAVELLLQNLQGRTRKRSKRKVFEFELCHRGSCCPKEA
jgi:DNA-binding LacI/PurR family transcriptional regulator